MPRLYRITLAKSGILCFAYFQQGLTVPHYIQALAIAQQEKSQLLTAAILDNLGGITRRAGDYAQTLKFQQQALTLHRGANNRIGEMITLGGLGNTAFSLKRYDEALKYQQQSLKIAQESSTHSGLLSASEIFDLKLNNADLVVLSACDTGRGDITGDGMVGLSRSFVAAGAPSVLVSLWAVDDSSTSELMAEFYRQLQSQPNKAEALRQAMLKIRKQKPNPFYWAAFILIGEAK